MESEEKECQKRVCRACNEMYEYPVLKSPATRFHCAACAELPLELRTLFEKYNKRVKGLLAQVDKLEQRCRSLEGKSSVATEKQATSG